MAEGPADFLGLSVKIFMAASALAGIVALCLSYFRVEIADFTPHGLALFGAGFIGLSVLIGAADLVQDRAKPSGETGRERRAENPSAGRQDGPRNQITDNRGNIIIDSPFRDFVVGESEEQRQERRTRAVHLLAGEIAGQLLVMGSRLHIIVEAFEPDTVRQRLDETRRRLAPVTADRNADGYDRLIAAQRAASLHGALQRTPLRPEIPGPLLAVIVEAQAPGSPVRFFYAQLAEVQGVTDSLLQTLDELAKHEAKSEAERNLKGEQLQHARPRVETYTQQA